MMQSEPADRVEPGLGNPSGRTPGALTLERYANLLDERTGIFATLRGYDLPWESPVHVCSGVLRTEFCRSAVGVRPAISTAVCGSGASAEQAKISCLCEALERRSGIFRGDEPRQSASYSSLAVEAVHPHELLLFSESQYRDREQWNQREGRHNWVPERFDPEQKIDWSPARSMTHPGMKYVPTAYCYFGYPFHRAHDFCRPDSNGNAAGGSVDEAIVNGFLEVVERECASVWWYNRVRRPRVEIAILGSPASLAVGEFHRLMGRSLTVTDITAEPAIPTYVAVSRPEEGAHGEYAFGFGAHFDPQVALTKALMEVTQFLPLILTDRDPKCFLEAAPGPSDLSFLLPEEPATVAPDVSGRVARGPREDVLFCVDLVKSWGLEMLVVEQTREDIGMPVVKVVVPGMRNWWADLLPGRLYDLPLRLGWLKQPTAECALNPCHLIL